MAQSEHPAQVKITGDKRAQIQAVKSAGAPGEGQLAAINRLALTELTAEQVYVRTAYLAHNGIDRDREAFSSALLADFARTLPGKGLFIKHPGGWDGDSGPGVGRWFEARVVKMGLDEARAALREPGLQFPPGVEEAELLEGSYYMPRSGKNEDLITDTDAGVAVDVSIGFAASRGSEIQDASGNRIGTTLHAPGEALEGSLVWLGAQPGARAFKSAQRNMFENEGEDDVDLKEQLKAAETKATDAETARKAAETKAQENDTKAKAYDAVVAVVGEGATAEQVKALVEDGKTYRTELVDELATQKRLQGSLADDAEAVAAAKAFYQTMPLPMLKSEVEALRKTQPTGGQLAGGDPNTTGADGKEKPEGDKNYTSPLDNPALKSA